MNTLFVGRNYTFLAETPSTNTYLNTLMSETWLAEGTVISTGYQTAGRGQSGNIWEGTRDENIMLSVLFYPRFLSATGQFQLSKAIALAVRDFLANFLPADLIVVKWPNDILVSGSKICGILIE